MCSLTVTSAGIHVIDPQGTTYGLRQLRSEIILGNGAIFQHCLGDVIYGSLAWQFERPFALKHMW